MERIKVDYDWTFTSDYRGTFNYEDSSNNNNNNNNNSDVTDVETKEGLNMALLKDTTQPILWSQYIILYEDELSDFGMSQVYVRIRVMPKCFLILLRFWMRVDNVILRIYDTRIYHEFNNDYVIKNIMDKEVKWNTLPLFGLSKESSKYIDPDTFQHKLPVKYKKSFKINLKKSD